MFMPFFSSWTGRPESWLLRNFLTSNGNGAPDLFKRIAPAKVGGKLVARS